MDAHTNLGDEPSPPLDPAEICTLPPRDLTERLAWIRHEILPHVRETRRIDGGLVIELAPADGLTARLDAWIAAERECCTGMRMEHVPSERPGGGRRLEIHGVDPDAPIFASLMDPSPHSSSDPTPRTRAPGIRLALAAGAGLSGSLVVCCLLPIAIGAMVGGTTAFAALDAPLPIALGALAGGIAAWRWLGRSAEPRASGAGCGADC